MDLSIYLFWEMKQRFSSDSRRYRLDDLVVKKGFAEDRRKAAALVLSGVVLVDGQRVNQSGVQFKEDVRIRIKKKSSGKFASRAGEKLEEALRVFRVTVKNRICWDFGASTGGFTDCLLQKGAKKVYAVDVGHGLLHWDLQKNNRVILRDRINVRYLNPEEIGEKPDIITVDLSFISLRLVLPGLLKVAPVTVVALVKPQFEARRSEVEPGGLVSDDRVRTQIIQRLENDLEDLGIPVLAQNPSGVYGRKGNREHFFLCKL